MIPNTRENGVLVYKPKEGNVAYCRLCLLVDIRDCLSERTFNHTCCCVGSYPDIGQTSSWEIFDNRVSIPLVLSNGICYFKNYNICSRVCNGNIQECHFGRL